MEVTYLVSSCRLAQAAFGVCAPGLGGLHGPLPAGLLATVDMPLPTHLGEGEEPTDFLLSRLLSFKSPLSASRSC